MAEPHDILTVTSLSAGYAGQPVVTGIDLQLRQGDVLGLLGANGAGKSTLLKTITGQLRPLSGAISIAGADLATDPVRAKQNFGLAIDGFDLPPPLTGAQYLSLIASIRGCAPTDWACADVIGRLNLGAWLHRRIAEYSLGTRAKIAIAAALLGAPLLLIFDESLNGLDPIAAWEAKSMIRDLTARGDHAVIISTHILETVPALCTRALFLAGGRIAQTWTQTDLVAASQSPGSFEAAVIADLKQGAKT